MSSHGGAPHALGRLGSRHPVSLTEPKPRLALIAKVPTKEAEGVKDAMLTLLSPLSASIHTITSDNGKEFARHESIAKAPNADFYFAHPYSSWERGLDENTNGLIRQYCPNGCGFTTITDKDIQRVMEKLNNRPRKCLGMKTLTGTFRYQPTRCTSELNPRQVFSRLWSKIQTYPSGYESGSTPNSPLSECANSDAW